MNTETVHTAHEGRNVKRIREILGIKQEALAADLGLSQQAISQLEQKEDLDADLLHKVATALKVAPEAIKHFNEEAAVNIFANTVHNNSHDHSSLIASAINYQPTFNPLDKMVQLYEEKTALYERMLEDKTAMPEKIKKLLTEKP